MKHILLILFIALSVYGQVRAECESPLFPIGQSKVIADECLFPEDFGAKGDNRTDDTEALRNVLKYSNESGVPVIIRAGQVYYVTAPLNFIDGEYKNLTLNLKGVQPKGVDVYSPGKYGGIRVKAGISLFRGASINTPAKIYGSISGVAFGCIQRKTNTYFFNMCNPRINMESCTVGNFGAFLFDSSLNVSGIYDNKFLSVYFFSKAYKVNTGIIDSILEGNYINGGLELNDNTCFECVDFNGSIITHNFIDYYRSIYQPHSITKSGFYGPLSNANQYQVFRYFYVGFNSGRFYSQSDSFNWLDTSSLDKLKNYSPISETINGLTIIIPPYIMRPLDGCFIKVSDAKIERNVGKFFLDDSVCQYQGTSFEGTADNPIGGYIDIEKAIVYNGGKYKDQRESRCNTNIVEYVNSLPKLSTGWGKIGIGHRIIYKGKEYRASYVDEVLGWYDQVGNKAND